MYSWLHEKFTLPVKWQIHHKRRPRPAPPPAVTVKKPRTPAAATENLAITADPGVPDMSAAVEWLIVGEATPLATAAAATDKISLAQTHQLVDAAAATTLEFITVLFVAIQLWEYEVVHCPSLDSANDALNYLGMQGWEAYSVVAGNGVYFFLKRPVQG